MNAIHLALKNQMKKAKVDHPAVNESHEAVSEAKKEENLGDKAPDVGAGADSPMNMAGVELGPEHLELLAKLISQIEHPARGAMGLDEKAGGLMKEKMASIMKHKAV